MKKLLLLLLLVPMVGFSQKYKAKVFPGFDRQANLVLISKYSNSNFPGICENYLLMEGFNVLSESVATKRKKEMSNKISFDSEIQQDVAVSETTYVDTKYMVEITFQDYNDSMMGWVVKSANIKITDSSTGKIMAIASRKGGGFRKNADKVAEKLISTLVKQIK
jgi:hypothetical protein